MLTAETSTVKEENLTLSTLTPTTQNSANIKLLQSILDRNDDDFDAALSEGADPNATGLWLPNRKNPKMAPALLIVALIRLNHYQAETLIQRGAKVDIYDEHQIPAIQMVVEMFGNELLVPLILEKDPSLIDRSGNLLMGTLVCFNSLTLLRKMSLLEDKTCWHSFSDYYNGRNRIPPTPPAELYYTSNTPMIELLLKTAPYQVHKKVANTDKNDNVEADISPFELVQNPRNYVQLFHNSGLGCRYLEEETLKEPDPRVLLFEVQFRPAWEPNKIERPNMPWIKIRYHFNPIYRHLEFVSRQQIELLHKQQMGLSQGLQGVKQNVLSINNNVLSMNNNVLDINNNVVHINKNVQVVHQGVEQNTLQLNQQQEALAQQQEALQQQQEALAQQQEILKQHEATLQKHEAELEHLRTGMVRLAAVIEKNHPFHTEIESLRQDPCLERLFDNVCIDLHATLCAYIALSSGQIARNQNKPLDYATEAFKALADQLPWPFSTPASLSALVIGKISDIREVNRCKSIQNCVGTEVQPCAQTLAYQLTCHVQQQIRELGHDLADLKTDSSKPYKQIDLLSKKVFVATVHQIYDVNNLGIDMKASFKKRHAMFLKQVIAGVQGTLSQQQSISQQIALLPNLKASEHQVFTPTFALIKGQEQNNNPDTNHSPTKNGHSTSSSESPTCSSNPARKKQCILM